MNNTEKLVMTVKGAFCIFGMFMLIMLTAGCNSVPEKKLASTPAEAVEMYLESKGDDRVESYEITGIAPQDPDGPEYIKFKAYDEDGKVLYTGSLNSEYYME